MDRKLTKSEIIDSPKDNQGGFPDWVMSLPCVVDHIDSGNCANGGGYLGRIGERTVWRDICTLKNLMELGFGNEFTARFLCSRMGRYYAEHLSEIDRERGHDISAFCYQIGDFMMTCKDNYIFEYRHEAQND